jgi:hypothetical protein
MVSLSSAQTTVVGTIVGTGEKGFAGDGGPASAALLASPSDVAVDSRGSVYIADSENQRIRKVSPTGIITTVAGNGQRGFSGDGGPAIAASLDLSSLTVNFRSAGGVAVDDGGNLYIADTNNNRIRRVGLDGRITTIAGNGIRGYTGDGGSALLASLANPTRMFVDPVRNIYFIDKGNGAIRKISTNGAITTAARGFWEPETVAVDAGGNIYVADSYFFYDGMIFEVNPDGNVEGLAQIQNLRLENGHLTASSITDNPWLDVTGLVLDPAGNPIVSYLSNSRVILDGFGNSYTAAVTTNQVRIVERPGPTLSLDSAQYCVGDTWNLRVGRASPVKAVQLRGTLNGRPWEIPNWRSTATDGTLSETGVFGAGTEAGDYTLQVTVDGKQSNAVAVKISSCHVSLTLNSSAYCTGDSWTMKMDSDLPNAPVRLAGTSNGIYWELPDWRQTGNDGGFVAGGVFLPDADGAHTLRAWVGASHSNAVPVAISRCGN